MSPTSPHERALRRLRIELAEMLRDELGEVTPASYLLTLMIALPLLFFTLDLGLRQGSRVALRYAASCAARAAVTQLPIGDSGDGDSGACVSERATAAIRHAAAACMAAVVDKSGTAEPTEAGSLRTLVARAEERLTLRILDKNGKPWRCFAHHDVITVELTYLYTKRVALSPLSIATPLFMKASGQAMLHTLK